MLALASVLSMVKVWEMPLGGSVTLLSMLPIIIVSIKYGVFRGLIVSAVYSLIQIGIGFSNLMSWGMTAKVWVGCIVFDYILAYTVLGIAGIFRNKGTFGICAGIFLALALRFISHFISGSIFFDIWCPEGWNIYIYSLSYNGTYMLPELIFTMLFAVILLKQPQSAKFILKGNDE
jgi:thiamine transporter